jgi:ATP-binding cassette subfamily B protein
MTRADSIRPPKDVLDALCWPVSRLGEAIGALARRSGLKPQAVTVPPPPEGLLQPDNVALERWMEGAADWLGVEAELIEAPYAELPRMLHACGPCLLRLHWNGPLFLLVLQGGGRQVTVLGPDLEARRVPAETLRSLLCWDIEAPLLPDFDRIAATAGVRRSRQRRMRNALLRDRIRDVNVRRCWHLRLAPGASFLAQLRRAGLGRGLLILVGAHAAAYGLWLLSWWAVGRGALSDRLDPGLLLAWGLLLLTLVPLRLLTTWVGGTLAIGASGLLKRRLLAGALLVDADAMRHEGVGQLLGRVIEAEQVESLGLGGGLLGFVAVVELIAAAGVLGLGAGGAWHAVLLVAWAGLCVALGARYALRRARWTDTRLELTNDLVERMVGHRTRLAQESPERWHDGEDRAQERYLEQSRQLDRAQVLIEAFLPRGWLVLGVAGLANAFVRGDASPAALAVGLGGVLLAYRALRTLLLALSQLTGAAIAWRRVAPLFQAAVRAERALPTASGGQPREAREDSGPLVEAHGLVFRYQERRAPVLRGCDLRIHPGDRLLLEGPSGGGKSTLGALLTGLRLPEEGVLLLDGLDRRTLGPEGWRRRVVAAPQFQENHVLTGSLSFNLLMGRSWPPRPGDLDAALEVCRALGLGELVERMPAGLEQVVGETGWQLSHGERSRLYIARALLQGADLVVLDESFGALDPETLRQALRCVLERAPTVLVIAHP